MTGQLLLGTAGFALCAAGDVWGALYKKKGGGTLFVLGCLALMASAAGLLADCWPGVLLTQPWRWIFAPGAAVGLGLLVHTLFFALPSAGSSPLPPEKGMQPLADKGVYGLCRHPGVLWLGMVLLCLWGLAGEPAMGAAFGLFTGLDIAYVWWQDRFVFPKTIQGYTEYQQRVPFLLPAWPRKPRGGNTR